MPDKTDNLAPEHGMSQHSSTTKSSGATREQDPPIIEIYKPDPNDASRRILRFECVYCSKEFSERYLLKRHFPVHTGQRQYVCPFCGKTFTSGSSLSRHKSVHKSESDFQCPVCNKTFNRTSTLATHMAIHSSEKKFVCKVCKKGFHQKVNLKNHIFTHSGEKPYHCKYCAVSFTQKTNLTMHVKRNHKDATVQYQCHQCSASFSLRKQLRAHHREKHYDAIIKSLKPRGKSLNAPEIKSPKPHGETINATEAGLVQRKLKTCETQPKDLSYMVQTHNKKTGLYSVLSSDKTQKFNQECGFSNRADFPNKEQTTRLKPSILDSHLASRSCCEIAQKDLSVSCVSFAGETRTSNCFSGLADDKDSFTSKGQTPRHRPNILPCRQHTPSSNKALSPAFKKVSVHLDCVKYTQQSFPKLAKSSKPVSKLYQFNESNSGVKQVDISTANEGLLPDGQESSESFNKDLHPHPPPQAPAADNKPPISFSGPVHISQNILQSEQPLVSNPSDSSCLALFNSSTSDPSLQPTTASTPVNVESKICRILVPRSCARGPTAENSFRGESSNSGMPVISRTRVQELLIQTATRTSSKQLSGSTSNQQEHTAYSAFLQPHPLSKDRDKTKTQLSESTAPFKTDPQKALEVNSCLASSATNDLMDLSLDVNAFANSVFSGARQALQLLNGGSSVDSLTDRQERPQVAKQTVTDKLPSSLENCVHKKDTGMFVKFTNFLSGRGKSYKKEGKSKKQPKVSAMCLPSISSSASMTVTSPFSSSSLTPLYTSSSKVNTASITRAVDESGNPDYATVTPAGPGANLATARVVTVLQPNTDSVPVVSLQQQTQPCQVHVKGSYPECTVLTASTGLNSAKVQTGDGFNSANMQTGGALNSTQVQTGGAFNSTQVQACGALNSTRIQTRVALNSTRVQTGGALNSTRVQTTGALDSTRVQTVQPGGAFDRAQVQIGSALNSTQVQTVDALNSTLVQPGGALNSTRVQTRDALNSTWVQSGGSLNSARVQTEGALNSTQVQTGGALNTTQVQTGGALNSTQVLTGGALNSFHVLTRGALNSAQVQSGGALNSAQVQTGGALSSTQVQTGNQIVEVQLVPVVPNITQQANTIPLVLQSSPWQQQVDSSIQTLDRAVFNMNTAPTATPRQTVLQNFVVVSDILGGCSGNVPLVAMPLSTLSVPGVVTINSTGC